MLQLGHDQLLGAYRRMSTIRAFEERLHDEIKTGEIGGFTRPMTELMFADLSGSAMKSC
jgi:TPP-dependent pyruvate/acetoin dehydrogenase alpha subunit